MGIIINTLIVFVKNFEQAVFYRKGVNIIFGLIEMIEFVAIEVVFNFIQIFRYADIKSFHAGVVYNIVGDYYKLFENRARIAG